MSSGGYLIGKTRAGDDPSTPVVPAGDAPDQSQARFRASDVAAPTTPALPIVDPGTPRKIGLAGALAGESTLLLWQLVPQPLQTNSIFTDYAWRWNKHPGQPSPAMGASPYMGSDTHGVFIHQAPIASGGGSYTGNTTPALFTGSTLPRPPILDPVNTPVWTLGVSFDTSAVTVNGVPPTMSSTSMTMPAPPQLTHQPIVGDTYTNSPWVLYVAWGGTWVGVPGAWSLVLSGKLILSWGGSGGPTTTVAINGRVGGDALIEFNNTANTILLVGGTTTGNPPGMGSLGDPIHVGAGNPGGWPGDYNGYAQSFGSSNMGPYYWSSYRQMNGYLYAVAIVPLSGEDTVALINKRSFVPDTGPVAPNVRFRAAPKPSPGLSAELSEYTHYWPLDDPSPGPMYDLLAGSYLTVVNPSHATFGAPGIVNPLAPTHTKSLGLGWSGASSAYLTWNGRGPQVSLGTGAVGHDLTIGCWIYWEGPPGGGTQREIIASSLVPYSFVFEYALRVSIWPSAEPFGVEFSTWDAVGHNFKTLRPPGFDWPAAYGEAQASPFDIPIPFKGPTWAYLTVVMRTVGGHMTMEIWMDGVLLAAQLGADGGWGQSVSLNYVGRGISPCLLQHLTIWPFALSPAAISGAGA